MPATRGGDRIARQTLKFKEKLVGKGLATDALLKKLKALQKELAGLDQERVDASSLDGVRKELISATLLLHKDRGVKAHVACCIADLLRLYAPNAPYTPPELQDIFEFFFRQVATNLTGADAPYYSEYYTLLESLSGVKTVVLVCDVPSSEQLITTVFKDFFAVVKKELPKKIEMFMADILVTLIDESEHLPAEVLEKYLLPQFKSKHARMNQPGFRLAVAVCKAAADRLQQYVCSFFTDLIVEHAESQDYDEISAAHDIIKHINRSCPSLLHNVVPQLEEEMRMEDAHLRTAAVQVLGEMFADTGGKELIRKYPNTWEYWLSRRMDKDASVRVTWVETARDIFEHNDMARSAVEAGLSEKLLEPDEKVRLAACKLYGEIEYEVALHYVSEKQLQALASRFIDKKGSIREQSMASLGKLYGLAYTQIESGDPLAISQFAWIPQAILKSIAIQAVKPTVEAAIAEHILPLPTLGKDQTTVDEVAWTDRLLTTMRFLDDPKAVNGLIAICGVKQSRPTWFDKYLDACIDNNGGVIDEDEEEVENRLATAVAKVAATFADPQRATDDLNAFAKLNQERLYKLMKTCFDSQTDLKGLVKASADFHKRLEQSSASLLGTMAAVVRRGSLHLINTSSIPTLVKRVQRGEQAAAPAHTLLTYASKHCPALYTSHVAELAKALTDEKNPQLVEVCLQALAGVVQWDNSLYPTDKRTSQRLVRFVTSSNERHAKFAARLLSCANPEQGLPEEAVESIANSLPEADPDQVVAHIAALAQFASFSSEAVETRSEGIVSFLVKNVLAAPSAADEEEEGPEWVDDDKLWPELRARIAAVKFCRNRCLAHGGTEGSLVIAEPVLRMLISILFNMGSLAVEAEDDLRVKARMRLQAGKSLLRLATVPEYQAAITQTANFVQLALVAQDPLFPVRQRFVGTLLKLLVARQLPARFNTIVFITAHDPDPEIPNMVKSYLGAMTRAMMPRMRMEELEMPFVRVLHLLAHHPDLDKLNDVAGEDGSEMEGEEATPKQTKHETLLSLSKYIQFYVDQLVNQENISLIYHLALKVKTVRDAEGDDASERLYIAAELAQVILKQKSGARNWALQSYPGKVRLPADVFAPAQDPEEQKRVLQRAYLPDETVAWFGEQGKVAIKEKQKAGRKARAGTKRKAPAAKKNGGAKRARRKKAQDSDDDDDDEGSSAEEMDVDDVDESDPDAAEEEEDNEPPPPTSSPRDSRPARGARTRANAKIKQQTKPKPKPRLKNKAKATSDDDE